MHAEQRVARAKLGPAVQKARLSGDPQHIQRVEELRRDYRAIAAEAYLQGVVDAAPPLTAAQRDRLALLLSGGASA